MSQTRAFVLVQINIRDHEAYARYETPVTFDCIKRFGGQVLVVDDAADHVEGEWPYGRTVIVEFPSKLQARLWYDSPDYQARAKLRHVAADSNMAIVAGRPAGLGNADAE